MLGVRIFPDEDIGRVFADVLCEQGYKVDLAKDLSGEFTVDAYRDEWVDATETE